VDHNSGNRNKVRSQKNVTILSTGISSIVKLLIVRGNRLIVSNLSDESLFMCLTLQEIPDFNRRGRPSRFGPGQ
jgi:hypothetical protein